MESIEILRPRLRGARFEHGAVPLSVLRDVAVLEEMLVELTKHQYRQANPQRQRLPRGFLDGVEVRLVGIEDGSAVLRLLLCVSTSVLPTLHPVFQYAEQAQQSLVEVIDGAGRGQIDTGAFPPAALAYFDRFGRSLRADEAIDLETPRGATARLTQATRRALVLAAPGAQAVTELERIRGLVPEADQNRNSFEVLLGDGHRVKVPLAPEHRDVVLEAFRGYRDGAKVLVEGTGKRDRNRVLRGLESVEHISLLDPLDIDARLDELASLRDGWYDGRGMAYQPADLVWLREALAGPYPDQLPLPRLYPTVEGGVLAEWSQPPFDASLEVALATRRGCWHALNLETDEAQTRVLDLASDQAWLEVYQLVAGLGGVPS